MDTALKPSAMEQRGWEETLADIKRLFRNDNINVQNRSLKGETKVEAVWGSLNIEEPSVTIDEVREALGECSDK